MDETTAAAGDGADPCTCALARARRAAAAKHAACPEDEQQCQDPGSRCRHGLTPPTMAETSLENATAVPPRFVGCLTVLRRSICGWTCSAVG